MIRFRWLSTFLLVTFILNGCHDGRETKHAAFDASMGLPNIISNIPSAKPEWRAGVEMSDDEVNAMGLDSLFLAEPLADAIFERINGISFNDQTPVTRDELRHLRLLHIDFGGSIRTGEFICNEAIADALLDIFRRLYTAGYPIESIRLIEEFDGDDLNSMKADNSSCFNTRGVGGGVKLSRHAYGMAVDINPLYNPLVKERNGLVIIQPEEGRDNAMRIKGAPHQIDRDDLCYRLFVEHGFKWGGSWRSVKDFQHFEK